MTRWPLEASTTVDTLSAIVLVTSSSRGLNLVNCRALTFAWTWSATKWKQQDETRRGKHVLFALFVFQGCVCSWVAFACYCEVIHNTLYMYDDCCQVRGLSLTQPEVALISSCVLVADGRAVGFHDWHRAKNAATHADGRHGVDRVRTGAWHFPSQLESSFSRS